MESIPGARCPWVVTTGLATWAAVGFHPQRTRSYAIETDRQPPCTQDNYDNLYGVVAGEKVFVLLPPAEAFRWVWADGEAVVPFRLPTRQHSLACRAQHCHSVLL